MMTAPTPGPIDIGGDSPQTPSAGRDQRGLQLAVGGAIAALVAVAAVFAAMQLTAGGGTGGGADSPEAVVAALFDALADENLDAAIELVVPDERESLGGPLYEALDELARIGLFSDDLDTSSISGIDIQVRGLDLVVEPVFDDLANVYAIGELVFDVHMRDLPLGSGLAGFLASMGEDPVEPESEPIDMMLTTVLVDGRWFISIFHTMGEDMRIREGWAPIPASASIAPRGAASPDELMERFAASIEADDFTELVALVSPREAGALHRYARPEPPSDGSRPQRIEDLGYRVEVSGDRAVVHLETYTLVESYGSWDTSHHFTRFEGECITSWTEYDDAERQSGWETESEPWLPDGATYADGRTTYCPNEMGGARFGAMGLLGMAGTPTALHLERIDGEWYLMPVTTFTEGTLDNLRGIDDDSVFELIGPTFMGPWGSSGGAGHTYDSDEYFYEDVEDYPTESTVVTDLDERSTPDTTWKADDRQLPPVDE